MPFTLNGAPLQRARVTVPRRGVWEGRVDIAGQIDLALGAAATLVLGDLTLAGHVVSGGTFAGASESSYTLAGGAAGWAATAPPRGRQVPTSDALPGGGGVKLVDEVAALATDAGERFDLAQISPTATVGDHWQRPGGIASVALSALLPDGWRVDPDGVTRPGVRPPAPLPRDLELAVEDYDPARRWARVGIRDDRVSALLPGTILVAGNLASPIVVGDLTVRAELEVVVAEVCGEAGIVEMLAAMVAALTPPMPLVGEFRYEVADVDAGAPNLRAISKAAGLPPTLACTKVYGLPGVTATLAPGSVVLVSFQDGSPARPCVSGYVSGTPVAVTLDASGTVSVGASATAVTVGGPTVPASAPAAVGHLVRYGDVVQVGSTSGPVTWVSGPITTGKT